MLPTRIAVNTKRNHLHHKPKGHLVGCPYACFVITLDGAGSHLEWKNEGVNLPYLDLVDYLTNVGNIRGRLLSFLPLLC